jgi:hypothetical protein
VLELSGYLHSDIATWAHQFYGPGYNPPLVDVNIDGGPLNPTVEALTLPGDLLALIGSSASRLDRGQREAIAALIRRDHEFHGKHRRGRTRPPR